MKRANSELAAQAWLKSVPGLPVNQIGTTLPQDNSTWAASGYVQLAVVGGTSTLQNNYRRPVIEVQCWSANPGKKNPDWAKANELAELIVAELYEDNGRALDLSIPGYPRVQVTQAWLIGEPRRVQAAGTSAVSHYARYCVTFGMSWVEIP